MRNGTYFSGWFGYLAAWEAAVGGGDEGMKGQEDSGPLHVRRGFMSRSLQLQFGQLQPKVGGRPGRSLQVISDIRRRPPSAPGGGGEK